MKRADRRKSEFKQNVSHFFKEHYYLFVSIGLILVAGVVGIVWSYFDLAKPVEYDMNTVLEDRIGEYAGKVMEGGFMVVEGTLEDSELITLQRSLHMKDGVKIPLYYVKDIEDVHDRISFYEEGLIKRIEWADEGQHQVITFEELASVKPNAVAVNDWTIYEDESQLEGNLYMVRGEIGSLGTSVDKLAQLRGLEDMIYELNEEIDLESFDAILFHMDSHPDDLYYHTDYGNVIGRGKFFDVTVRNEAADND